MYRQRELLELQEKLSYIGMVPIIGEPADALNAFIYMARGDTVNAVLSSTAMFPVFGSVSTGGKIFARSADEIAEFVQGASKSRWKVGEDIYSPTTKGNAPSRTTVRQRFWKNDAIEVSSEIYGTENIERMKKGLAPQRYNADKSAMESMELSHEPIPFRDGGKDFIPRWPQDHAAVDPFRHPGY